MSTLNWSDIAARWRRATRTRLPTNCSQCAVAINADGSIGISLHWSRHIPNQEADSPERSNCPSEFVFDSTRTNGHKRPRIDSVAHIGQLVCVTAPAIHRSTHINIGERAGVVAHIHTESDMSPATGAGPLRYKFHPSHKNRNRKEASYPV